MAIAASIVTCWYCVGCVEIVDYQGVVVAMTVLPGDAESACFIHKHKPLGDILRMPESRVVRRALVKDYID